MYRSKQEIRRNKKITEAFCRTHSIVEIIAVLRKDNLSELWNKHKSKWSIEDWKEFFKIKINSNESN